jgi:FkbM family methyltransferase
MPPMVPDQIIKTLSQKFKNTDIHWERILISQYSALPPFRTAIDIGAHAGLHTEALVLRSESVICVEPLPHLAEHLKQRFSGKAVTVHQCALSNERGKAKFQYNVVAPEESGLIRRQYPSDASNVVEIAVDVRTLDEIHPFKIDYIKVDCEGADLLILQGGVRSIMRDRPVISIEYGWAGYSVYGMRQQAIFDVADSMNCIVIDLFGFQIDRESGSRVLDRYYWDYFLVPREKTFSLDVLRRNGEQLFRNIEAFIFK